MAGLTRAVALLFTALLAVSAVSGARVTTDFLAPAPAPAATQKLAADVLLTLTATKATFTASDRLTLEGVQSTALAFNVDTRSTATYALGAFANTTAGAPLAAAWAGSPDALMYATRAGSATSALLRLSAPALDAAAGRLTFAVQLLPADAAQLTLSSGVTARAIDDVANGLGGAMLTEVPVGAELTSVALFIDEASSLMSAAATTKQWWDGCWNCNSWGNWQGQQQNANINNNNVVNNGWGQQQNTNINNNNVVNNGWSGQQNTNINNNNVVGNQGNTNINNNNVNSGVNINNNNVGR